jgi:hypothetical protein
MALRNLTFLMVCLLITSVNFAKTPATSKITIPSLLLCEKNKNIIAHVVHRQVDWSYELDGPLKDVQPQPDGSFLVTGGTKQVSLVKRAWKNFQVVWDWGKLDTGVVESAAAADWDEEGHPGLILAADSKTPRIFLAEAKSDRVKIRWEYKLPSPPRTVHLCPDSGNFLVMMKDSTVKEIDYQNDKEIWSLGKSDGFKDIRDTVRDPWARTYVADAVKGSITCLDPHKKLLWETHLPFAPSAFQDMALSLFRKSNKRLILASVHFSGNGSKAGNVVYLLNTETGKVLDWSDRLEKGFYPAFFKATLNQAFYYQKQ